MNYVFVVDTERRPMTPCHPARARALLREGKAAVLRRYPFTLILKESKPEAVTKPVTVKIDPGSKTTGIALVSGGRVVFAAELTHRGNAIKSALETRKGCRRNRRSRETRYRAARFLNRTRPDGWLPPSLMHRVLTTMTWVKRFQRYAPVTEVAVERVKFDMQKMQNPEISGVEYQQGELQGYEVREYLLEKWGRKCAYCDKEHVPLQVEHIQARANHGSTRVSNLTIACQPCNLEKGKQFIKDYLKHDPVRLARILKHAKAPLRDAAAVNATRNELLRALCATGLPVETGSGAQTKMNRCKQNYDKAHWIDAACVGESGAEVALSHNAKPLLIACTGHGNRTLGNVNSCGIIIAKKKQQSDYFGFKTGDLVKAVVPKGKNKGVHVGRVACRVTGIFDVKTKAGRRAGISYKYVQHIQRNDGYVYS